MFKFDAEWDVDTTAEYLNTSLFGKSKKRKVPETDVPASANNGSKFYSGIIPDSDDEQYSKNDKKRLKKIRKKNKHDKKSEDSTRLNKSYRAVDNVLTMSKTDYDITLAVPEQKLKVNTSPTKAGSHIAHVKNKKAKQKGKFNENNTQISSSGVTGEQNNKKRKRSLSESADNNKNKKAKFEESKNTVLSANDDTTLEYSKKKRKRNRKKKNNSKKNKYKHLAQNSISKTGNLDVSLGSSSVDTNKQPVDKKTSHPTLESHSNKSSENVHKNKVISSEKVKTGNPSEVQKQHTKKGKHSSDSDVLTLGENKSKEKRQNPKHSLPHHKSSQKNILPPTKKKTKKNKENSTVETSANMSQFQTVKKASDADKLSSAVSNVSKKNKVKQQVLLKMLNGAQQKKTHKTGDEGHADLTSCKKKRKKREITSVPSGSDISNCDLSPTAEHKFKNNTEIGGKQGNNSLGAEKKSTVNALPVAHSIWGKAADLGQQAREKLNSARFRYINEQLYSCKSTEALKLFREDHDAFSVYHEGFQNQSSKWPVNPLDVFIKQIRDKPKNLIIADFGCGDAKLAQEIPQKVHSFDLVALNSRVTACDMSKTPLSKEQVDMAVFCLSLMGTNITDYILEANRVLKTGGLLKIAEVVSRFSGLSKFTDGVCSCGFELLNKRDLNQMFYIMNFKKIKSMKKSASLPAIKLKPCVYKRR